MLRLILPVLLLVPSVTFGATIFMDSNLGTNCTAGTYSITNRNCTGSDGNAYNNIASALSASAAGDTINLRSGTYTSNVSDTQGINMPHAGQTWQTYPGDLPSMAQITAAANHDAVIRFDTRNGTQIKNLRLVGGITDGIRGWNSTNVLISGNDVSGYNTGSREYGHGIFVGSYNSTVTTGIIESNFVHDQSGTPIGNHTAGIALGGPGSSGIIIRNNLVQNTDMGIWLDIDAGNPLIGLTPVLVSENTVKNISRHCFHVEARSTGTFTNNLAINCGETAFLIRPENELTQLKIQNNTFYKVGATGIWLQTDQAGATVTNSNIDNNIIYDDANAEFLLTVGIEIIGQSTNTYRNNVFHAVNNSNGICWGDAQGTSHYCDAFATQYADTSAGLSSWQSATTTATGNISGDPLFVNADIGDFRLCEGSGSPDANCTAASPAINAGINVGLSYNGTAPDIGALESDSNTSPPPPDNLVSDTTISNPDTTISNPDLKKPGNRRRK